MSSLLDLYNNQNNDTDQSNDPTSNIYGMASMMRLNNQDVNNPVGTGIQAPQAPAMSPMQQMYLMQQMNHNSQNTQGQQSIPQQVPQGQVASPIQQPGMMQNIMKMLVGGQGQSQGQGMNQNPMNMLMNGLANGQRYNQMNQQDQQPQTMQAGPFGTHLLVHNHNQGWNNITNSLGNMAQMYLQQQDQQKMQQFGQGISDIMGSNATPEDKANSMYSLQAKFGIRNSEFPIDKMVQQLGVQEKVGQNQQVEKDKNDLTQGKLLGTLMSGMDEKGNFLNSSDTMTAYMLKNGGINWADKYPQIANWMTNHTINQTPGATQAIQQEQQTQTDQAALNGNAKLNPVTNLPVTPPLNSQVKQQVLSDSHVTSTPQHGQLIGADYLKTLPINVQAHVQALANGTESISTESYKDRSAWKTMVSNYDPTWNENRFNLRKAFDTSWQSSSPTSYGGQRGAVENLTQHLNQYMQDAKFLNNGQLLPANQLANFLKTQTGQESVNNAKIDMLAAGTETAKLLKGSGQLNESEEKNWQNIAQTSASPAQIHGAITRMVNLTVPRINNMLEKYKAAHGVYPGQDPTDPNPPFSVEAMQSLKQVSPQAYQKLVPKLGTLAQQVEQADQAQATAGTVQAKTPTGNVGKSQYSYLWGS